VMVPPHAAFDLRQAARELDVRAHNPVGRGWLLSPPTHPHTHKSRLLNGPPSTNARHPLHTQAGPTRAAAMQLLHS
jgi:hypothetical protein